VRLRRGLFGRKKKKYPAHFCLSRPKDPDVEDAPVVPEMGTIELRAYRTRAVRTVDYQTSAQNGLHRGRVSERSKKAGWHHVR
jgi:hypothetical protein